MNNYFLFLHFFSHFYDIYIEHFGRALHVIQALNGNKCNAYFVSGKIKALKKNIYIYNYKHKTAVIKDS